MRILKDGAKLERLLVKEISKEHLKRMVDIFGREATWSFFECDSEIGRSQCKCID